MNISSRFIHCGRRFARRLVIACLAVVLLPAFGSAADQADNLIALAAQTKHCVVNISTTEVLSAAQTMPFQGGNPALKDFFEHFFGQQMPQARREVSALGSGFIIGADGLILTNNHVVAHAQEIKVFLADGKEYDATVVGTDPQTDLALIRVEPDDNFPQPAKLGDSDALQVGASVMAVGNPFGLGQTVTSGILSAKGRIIGAGPYDDFLQTDAAINPGNSGGPLFNMQGEVIGINTAIVARGQGIGFAIPVNMAKELMPQLKAGKVVRGWLGIMIQDITPALAEALDLENSKGVLVSDTVPDGPAAKAGLRQGDVILELDGQAVDNAHDLSFMVAGIAPDTTVKITIRRDGNRQIMPVTLGTKPGKETAMAPPEDTSGQKWGMIVQDLTPQLADRLGFDSSQKGIVITKVQPASPAADAGLKPGDVIEEANRGQVDSVRDFTQALQSTKHKDRLLLLVKRGDGAFYSVLQRKG